MEPPLKALPPCLPLEQAKRLKWANLKLVYLQWAYSKSVMPQAWSTVKKSRPARHSDRWQPAAMAERHPARSLGLERRDWAWQFDWQALREPEPGAAVASAPFRGLPGVIDLISSKRLKTGLIRPCRVKAATGHEQR